MPPWSRRAASSACALDTIRGGGRRAWIGFWRRTPRGWRRTSGRTRRGASGGGRATSIARGRSEGLRLPLTRKRVAKQHFYDVQLQTLVIARGAELFDFG